LSEDRFHSGQLEYSGVGSRVDLDLKEMVEEAEEEEEAITRRGKSS
jgi:hypothetical protein